MIGLAVVVAVEGAIPEGNPSAVSPIPVPDSSTGAGAADGTESEAWATAALARPLFRTDRRPLSQVATAAGTSVPRLTAIILYRGDGGGPGDGRVAVFAPDDGKPIAVGIGGAVKGYRVDRIDPDGVGLAGPDGVITLHPRFLTAGATGATPISPQAGRTTTLPPSGGGGFTRMPDISR
jgi:hypothetical protein